MPGPLAAIRIVDTTTMMLGPYSTQLLADLGATVTKIESVEGDPLRHVGPSRNPGMATTFLNLNRNKHSVVLDLKSAAGKAALLKLAVGADVFVHNMRPRALERLGLDYQALREVNAGIIHAGAFGFGQRGRYADQPAYDDTIQALCGLASLQSAFSGAPAYQATIPADKTVAVYFATAILAALLHRARTGEGQQVEVPMFEAMTAWTLAEHIYGAGLEPPQGEPVYPRVVSPNRRPYATRDGHVAVVAYNERQWTRIFEGLGMPGVMRDPRFATLADRTRNVDALYGALAEGCARVTTDEALDIFRRADVPAVRVATTSDLLSDPHLADVGLFDVREHPSEGMIRMVRSPFELSATPAEIRCCAPRLGEHTQAALRDAGCSDAEIADALRANA
jgi:crotonobetainyl-CoA:carnitine CoA-transferase CaiB-like acyl-CoA transferase